MIQISIEVQTLFTSTLFFQFGICHLVIRLTFISNVNDIALSERTATGKRSTLAGNYNGSSKMIAVSNGPEHEFSLTSRFTINRVLNPVLPKIRIPTSAP